MSIEWYRLEKWLISIFAKTFRRSMEKNLKKDSSLQYLTFDHEVTNVFLLF
jgi:hypothetical protein